MHISPIPNISPSYIYDRSSIDQQHRQIGFYTGGGRFVQEEVDFRGRTYILQDEVDFTGRRLIFVGGGMS